MVKIEFERMKPCEVVDLRGRWMIFCPEKSLGEIDAVPESCFGAVFPAVIFRGKVYDDRVIAANFDDLEVEVFRGDSLRDIDGKTLLVLIDGTSERAEEILDRAFAKYGGITYLGGGAGSIYDSIDCLFDGKGFFRESCLFISLPFELDVKTRHGWKQTQFELITTRTDGRRILELDWRPAFETYRNTLESMGVEVTHDNFFEVAKNHPFGLRRLEREMMIRDPLSVDGDALVCAGRVPQNCIVSLMYGSTESLLTAARECAGGELLFDCVSRAMYMGDDFRKELKILKDASGALTVGEVAAKKTYPELQNKSVVVGDGR